MTSRPKSNIPALPLSRVKTIMRSSPEVSSISPDAIALTSHSAQLFVSQLVKDAYNIADKESAPKLEYKHLSRVVATNPRMSFLQDILPEKIRVKDYRLMLESIRQKSLKENCADDNQMNSEDSEEDVAVD